MSGTLQSYLRWPLLLAILLVVMNVLIYFINIKAGIVTSVCVTIYIVVAFLLYYFKRSALLDDLVNYAMRLDTTINKVANNIDFPTAILSLDGQCLWENKKFKALFSQELPKKHSLSDAIPYITIEQLPKNTDKNSEFHFQFADNSFYKANIQLVDTENLSEESKANLGQLGLGDKMYIVYMNNETENIVLMRENNNQRMDFGFLYIDNYEESLATLDEVKRSLAIALINRKINRYMSKIDAIVQKTERDKYLFMYQHKYLSKLQTDKFSILDEIRKISVGDEHTITASIGIGTQADTYTKRQEYARTAIDLALARGGDQAVIKNRDNILYYGGKTIQQEKTTRVRARVKAHALRDSIEAASKIIIMGHRLPDVDAIGSALGIYRLAETVGKPSKIVVNQITSSLAPLMEKFENNKDYPADLFVNTEGALEFVGDGQGVLLVVVDVNRPSYTDCPEIISKVSSLIVIDHHRQTSERFENPNLSYVESYASSASEMVAEILQYSGEEIALPALEADALYSGIMIDTNNFMNKPGVRTFEAVAYLRKSGADIIRIRKMFRSDLNEYKVRAQAIQNTEIYLNHYAIGYCNADSCISPTIVGAKIANDLLDINGIKASFVLTEFEGKIYISARSIDELNVQVVMEKLGGGGHITSAGAQVNGSYEDAARKIKATIATMRREGEIK